MARADTRTMLSLDRFAQIVGINPLHFNGVFHDLAPANTCGQPMMQHAWQVVDGTAREDIATAIAEAEENISAYLGYRMMPKFESDERHTFARAAQPEMLRANLVGPAGMNATVKLDHGYVISGGIEARTAITLNASVVYTDDDGDGYNETATVAVTTSVTDANELCLFLPGEGGASEFEIRPVRVSVLAGTATFIARREQLVIPALWEQLAPRGVDGSQSSNFLTTVDVYRVWLDPQQQVQMLWENSPLSCGCQSTTCSTCYLTGQFGCTLVRDNRLGLIGAQPALWNSATGQFEWSTLAVGRSPDRGRFWYRAGWRKPGATRWAHEMDPKWERLIAYYAVGFLHRGVCGCRNIENITTHWGQDLARSSSSQSTSESFRISNKHMDNPLGTTRGALHAWRAIRAQAIGDSVDL